MFIIKMNSAIFYFFTTACAFRNFNKDDIFWNKEKNTQSYF
ncbi:hypothetical protein C8J95_1105 [Elizabethkingia sp. YR214]|nr:hypothetical protein C8J95_1105 [Elizabethkingia sp. YR214]